ncbi:hypothetical protein EMO89_00495 [Bifidobacterium tissieri]|uniref:Uncharacterized protein n=1 Tax=Bifidobacterium tissieri TaxID=1630162 RepID=A0A5M9ZWM0_9BIFI|nr:hypothetical protein [Bifidobacterium tissieri]KAA8832041.1 hypothetical protein EMO89_00495 [Bifidobacterium tissieri]
MGGALRKKPRTTSRKDAIDALVDRIMPEPEPIPELPDEPGDYRRVVLASTPELKERWGRDEYKAMVNVRTGNTVTVLHDGSVYNVRKKSCRDHLVANRDEHLLAEGMAVTILLRITRPDLYEHSVLPALPFDLNEARESMGLPRWEPSDAKDGNEAKA